MEYPRFDGFSEYRWPLLFSLVMTSTSVYGTVTEETITSAEFRECRGRAGGKDPFGVLMASDRRLVHGELHGGRPNLKMVTVSVAATAKVATDRHVH
jgi:hypothetical protein